MDKVMCPWCGEEMKTVYDCDPLDDMWYARYGCKCGSHTPWGLGKSKTEAIVAANLSETRRPPNLPLTEAQIMALPDDDAIYTIGFAKDIYVWDSKETKLYMQKFLNRPINRLFFAAKPTPADIEAARKSD